MHKHTFFVLMTTFLFGCASGGILYVRTHTGEAGDGALPQSSEMSVVARESGLCESTFCPSYRIDSYGGYRYISEGGGDGVRVDGELSRVERRTIMGEFKSLGIETFTPSLKVVECDHAHTNVHAYIITTSDASYAFDTCTHDIEEVPFFHTLDSFFETFASQHVTP